MFSSKYRKGYAKSLVSGMRYGYKYAPLVKYLVQRYSGAPAPDVVKRSYKAAKKAPPRKYRKRYNKKKTLTRKVNELSRQVKSTTSKYIKKSRNFDQLINTTDNYVNMVSHAICSITQLQAAIDSVKYFDPSVPGTLINVDLSAPTFQNQVYFKRVWGRITARNNYGVPCKVTLYVCTNKKDTSITPITAINNGLADMSNGAINDTLVYPTDVHDFNDLWNIEKSKSFVLNPGDECSISHSVKPFRYDVSLSDSHNTEYAKYFHGSVLMIRLTGILCHGATSGASTIKAGVDYHYDRIYEVQYPGGADTTYLEISDNPETMVGTATVSIPDAQQAIYTL